MIESAQPGAESHRAQAGLARFSFLAPLLVALILSLPCLEFAWLWDDFIFYYNALSYRLLDLLPNPSEYFYRPISRGAYFILLEILGPHGMLVGHILNLAVMLGVVALFVSFASRLSGRRNGAIMGLLFASLGPLPFLVGWASGIQDLLAMLFILLAFHMRLSGRGIAAVGATLAALLSKETVIAFVPILVLFDWLIGRKPYRVARDAAAYAAMLVAWIAVHPAVRILLQRGFRSGATGYVGLEQPERWAGYLGKYVLTLLNVPFMGFATPWLEGRTPFLIAALGILVASLWLTVRRQTPEAGSARTIPRKRLIIFAILMIALPLVLTSTIIGVWAPYYALMPGMGGSLLLGLALARLPIPALMVLLAFFMTGGVWVRGLKVDPWVCTERNLAAWSGALHHVEEGFKRLRPTLPPQSQVLLSCQTKGQLGVYTHMFTLQALRTWYHDPTLLTLHPEARRPEDRPEFLFVVTPDRDVVEIDPLTLQARSSGAEPDYAWGEKAVRAYAMGLAGSGQTSRAVDILLGMPEIDPRLEAVHHRMAGMMLFAAGDTLAAAQILAELPTIDRGEALENLRAILAEPVPGVVFDRHAFRAFGLSMEDAEACRELMNWFVGMKYRKSAWRFAQQLAELRPNDPEWKRVIAHLKRLDEEDRRFRLQVPANYE